MNSEMKLNDIANDLLILNQITVDKIFTLEDCADCIALYIFYYKTAKWQKTSQIKANDEYCMQSLKWGWARLKKTKDILKANGLIEILQGRKENKICGWYIKINFFVKARTIESKNYQSQVLDFGKQMLNNNNKMLNNNNNMLKEDINNKLFISKKEKKSFTKPTLNEIKEYCLERENNIDANKFFDYYESIGWKVGKNSMKDWKACIRTWERNTNYNNKKEEDEGRPLHFDEYGGLSF